MDTYKESDIMNISVMLNTDTSQVLEIEAMSFDQHLCDTEFFAVCRQKRHVPVVLKDDDDNVLGYLIYSMANDGEIHIIRFAVRDKNLGHGKELIDYIKGRLSSVTMRTMLVCNVDEFNTSAQLWLASQGFAAIGVSTKPFRWNSHDGYTMCYKLGQNVEKGPETSSNRL